MDTEQRLQALEREFQRSRRVNRMLVLVVVALICIAGAKGDTPDESQAPTPKRSITPNDVPADAAPRGASDRLRTVEADQFVLLDRSGRSRARMVVSDDGPELSMFDEKGRKRLEISQTSVASGLRLLDSSESPVVSLQLPSRANAHLEIRTSQGRSVTKADGVSVFDAEDEGRLLFALINGNFPVLGINQKGQNGPSSIEMTAGEGSRALKLHDDKGHPLVSLFAADDGNTSLSMRHPDHERSLVITSGPKDVDGPAITLFTPANEDGGGGILPRLQFGLRKDRQPYMRAVGSDGQTQFAAPSQ